MLIEKFEIYKFKNVFYTKEELEELGFIYMESREDYFNLDSEKKGYYEIIEKSYFSESTHSLKEILDLDDRFIKDKFFFDLGNSGLILEVKKYYGIRFKKGLNKEELIQLFEDENDCIAAYKKIEQGINENFEELTEKVPNSFVEDSRELIRQNAEKETRQFILSLINKDTKNY